jgi:hypothetical protein
MEMTHVESDLVRAGTVQSRLAVFTVLGMGSRRKLDRARPAIRLPSRALGRSTVGVAAGALPEP